MRTILLLAFLFAGSALHAQNTIYAYAIADWKEGPVQMTSVFETTEAFTTAQLMERVKKDYPAFKEKTDIDVQRFATREEADSNQKELVAKYHIRGVMAYVHPSEAEMKKAGRDAKEVAPQQP